MSHLKPAGPTPGKHAPIHPRESSAPSTSTTKSSSPPRSPIRRTHSPPQSPIPLLPRLSSPPQSPSLATAMVRRPCADSPPIVPVEVTNQLSTRVARKRRTKDVDSIEGGVELRAARKRRAVESDSIQGNRRVEHGRRGFWVALKGKKRGSIVVEGRDFVQDSEEGGADEYLFVAEEESSVDSHQASGGSRGGCGRCGGGVLGSNGDYFLTEKQHGGVNSPDTENFGSSGLFPDTEEQTGDGEQHRRVLLNSEDVYFVHEPEQHVGGYVSEADRNPDDGLFLDSEELVGGRGCRGGVVLGAEDIYFVPESEQQAGAGFVPDVELHPNGCFIPVSEDSKQGNDDILNSELHPDDEFAETHEALKQALCT